MSRQRQRVGHTARPSPKIAPAPAMTGSSSLEEREKHRQHRRSEARRLWAAWSSASAIKDHVQKDVERLEESNRIRAERLGQFEKELSSKQQVWMQEELAARQHHSSLELLSSKTLWSKDESEFQNSSVIKAVVMITENTNISELSRSGLNGSYLKDNVYLSMAVTLSSALYHPTSIEYCSSQENGLVVPLTTTTGSWLAGSNMVKMNLDNFGASIYRGTPTWTNMNRLSVLLTDPTVEATITLSNIKLTRTGESISKTLQLECLKNSTARFRAELNAEQKRLAHEVKGLPPNARLRLQKVLNKIKGSRRLSGMQVSNGLGNPESDAQKVFERVDTSRNGMLDHDKLKVALMQMGLGMADDEVSELFEAIDLDGSGEVDLGEFCEMIVMLNNTTDYLGRLPCHRPVARAVASQAVKCFRHGANMYAYK